MTIIYDFDWDDQQDSGVWVVPPGKTDNDAVLVEASIRETREAEDDFDREIIAIWGDPTGDYILASEIKLGSKDGVATATSGRPLYGAAAKAALDQLIKIQNTGRQIPVNPEQEKLFHAHERK